EVELLLRAVDGDEADAAPVFLDWDALYGNANDPVAFDALDAFGLSGKAAIEADGQELVEDRASTVYRWGNRLSGVAFSPGGDISWVLIAKVLGGRPSASGHMDRFWQAFGWRAGVPVIRHEARLRRPAIRELGLPGELRSRLDDPWKFLTHVKDVFTAIVGRSS